jgi:uncharacterized membrane protein
MATLILLIVSFLILWLLNRFGLEHKLTLSFMGRCALAMMLFFTGISHFYKQQEMVAMMPAILPYKLEMVFFTGMIEITAAIGLLTRRFVIVTSFALILFFIAVLPANIIGAQKKVPLGGMENGPAYLYFRIPLQLLFILWTYYFGIHLGRRELKHTGTAHKHYS